MVLFEELFIAFVKEKETPRLYLTINKGTCHSLDFFRYTRLFKLVRSTRLPHRKAGLFLCHHIYVYILGVNTQAFFPLIVRNHRKQLRHQGLLGMPVFN